MNAYRCSLIVYNFNTRITSLEKEGNLVSGGKSVALKEKRPENCDLQLIEIILREEI